MRAPANDRLSSCKADKENPLPIPPNPLTADEGLLKALDVRSYNQEIILLLSTPLSTACSHPSFHASTSLTADERLLKALDVRSHNREIILLL